MYLTWPRWVVLVESWVSKKSRSRNDKYPQGISCIVRSKTISRHQNVSHRTFENETPGLQRTWIELSPVARTRLVSVVEEKKCAACCVKTASKRRHVQTDRIPPKRLPRRSPGISIAEEKKQGIISEKIRRYFEYGIMCYSTNEFQNESALHREKHPINPGIYSRWRCGK